MAKTPGSRIRLYGKSVVYSIKLLNQSSRKISVLYFVIILMNSTLQIFQLGVMARLLDALVSENLLITTLILYVGLLGGLVLLGGIFRSLSEFLYKIIMQKSEYTCNIRMLEKLDSLHMSELDSSKGHDEVDFVQNAQSTIVCFPQHLFVIACSLYSFIVVAIMLFHLNTAMTLMLLIMTIPSVVFSVVYKRKSDLFRRKMAPDIRKFSYYRWILTDSVPAKDVRMYDLTNVIKMRYAEEKTIYLEANKKLSKRKTIRLMFGEALMHGGEVLFVFWLVMQGIRGELSVGNISLYSGLVLTLISSCHYIVQTFAIDFWGSTAEMKAVFDFFDKKAVIAEGKIPLTSFESLAFENVYFRYPHTEKYVLNGASFTLNRGDKLSIIGINGSGKSTIIKLMLGLYEIESGQILINGYSISNYNIHDVRKLFSVLFQNFVQYPLTLRENIALSDLEKMDDDAQIESSLRQSGVYDDLQKNLANGLNSFMSRKFDDKGIELSKGQWQKIALSRAYFKNAPVIIFDEPSAALDAEAEDKIFKNFEKISDGKTGIMISHRISAARMSNKIIVLDNGKIVEQGTHDDLLSLGGLYAKLYNLQREKYVIKESE